MAALALLVARLACIRFEGMPDMPAGTGSDPKIYASDKHAFGANVATGRLLVRLQNVSWTLSGTAGERLATVAELRERYAGVVFIGDSQIREVAWAALQLLTPGQKHTFSPSDPVFRGQRKLGRSACVPQSVGKTGFTAACNTELCELHSPFHNKTHAEQMRRLLLTRPHSWDGALSVHDSVCKSDFFLSYQATWGAMPIEPTSLPQCLHPSPSDPEGKYALKHRLTGVTKPVLWIVDGCGLHEMEFCDARRDSLPQNAFARFPANLLRSGTVVYQPVGAGFLMRSSNRFKGECASVNSDNIALKERAWLDANGVRYYDYTKLALQYAPLMFDAIHFTYYWVPCAQTFPEMARLVAQLGFQHAVGRPAEVCPPGTPPSTPSAGGTSVSLAQDQESADRAYQVALHMSQAAKSPASKKGGKGQKASAPSASLHFSAAAAAAASAASAATTHGFQPPAASESLETAIQHLADDFGGKKRSGALATALKSLTAKYKVGATA